MEIKFAKVLRELRRQNSMSQQALATAINTTQRKISYLENNIVEPDLTTLCLIADYFDVSIDFLLGRKNY